MKPIFRILAILSAATALSSPALAQGVGKGPCKDDIKTYCSDVQRGGGRIIKCLNDNSTKISEACHTMLEKVNERKQEGGQGANDNAAPAGGKPGEPPPPSTGNPPPAAPHGADGGQGAPGEPPAPPPAPPPTGGSAPQN